MRTTSYSQYLLEQDLNVLLYSLNEASIHDWISNAKNLINKAKGQDNVKFLLDSLYKKLKNASSVTKSITLKHLLPLIIGGTIVGSAVIKDIANRSNDIELRRITQNILDGKKHKKHGPDWAQYKKDADSYLKLFKNSPITGDMMANAAKSTFERTGTLVPVDLALAQGQFESQLGTDPKHRNPRLNPFSVGEDDDRTRFHPKSTLHGVQAYYNLMANKYLHGKSVDQLLSNFVNTKGERYASNKKYEDTMKSVVNRIRKFLTKARTARQDDADEI